MPALHQVAAHVQAAGGGDVAWLAGVTHHQAGQQAQTQGVVTVGGAGSLDLSPSAAHAPGTEELHRIGGLHLGQLDLAAAGQQVAVGLQDAGAQAGGQEDFAAQAGQAGDAP